MNKTSSAERMVAHWGDNAPEWVCELAQACDATSQNKVGKLLNYSGATISLVLKNCYSGDMATFEKAVRGAFMKETVKCPVLGNLPKNECIGHQNKPFSSANSLRIQLFKACHKPCPHSRFSGE